MEGNNRRRGGTLQINDYVKKIVPRSLTNNYFHVCTRVFPPPLSGTLNTAVFILTIKTNSENAKDEAPTKLRHE